MSLIKWEPFGEMEDFFDDIDFPSFKMDDSMAVDVYEKGKNIIAEMNLPGVDPENVEIEVEDGYLRISGEHKSEKEEKEKNYYSREIRRGSFQKVVALPGDVQKDKVKAECEDGVLKVILPKATETKKNKVKVEVKGGKKKAGK